MHFTALIIDTIRNTKRNVWQLRQTKNFAAVNLWSQLFAVKGVVKFIPSSVSPLSLLAVGNVVSLVSLHSHYNIFPCSSVTCQVSCILEGAIKTKYKFFLFERFGV